MPQFSHRFTYYTTQRNRRLVWQLVLYNRLSVLADGHGLPIKRTSSIFLCFVWRVLFGKALLRAAVASTVIGKIKVMGFQLTTVGHNSRRTCERWRNSLPPIRCMYIVFVHTATPSPQHFMLPISANLFTNMHMQVDELQPLRCFPHQRSALYMCRTSSSYSLL